MSQLVKLNVGGVFYDTSLQTLLVHDSYFSALLSDHWNKKDENGRIFIDRDGRAFEYVLDFLRNGKRMMFPESLEMKQRIRREADYYILPELADLFDDGKKTITLRIGGPVESIDISLSMANMKSIPGSWFDETFSANDVKLPQDKDEAYLLDRKNFCTSAIIAEYVAGDSRHMMKMGKDKKNMEKLMDEAMFFKIPPIIYNQLIAHFVVK